MNVPFLVIFLYLVIALLSFSWHCDVSAHGTHQKSHSHDSPSPSHPVTVPPLPVNPLLSPLFLPFSYSSVHLTPSAHSPSLDGQSLNSLYLRSLAPSRLLYTFYVNSGLTNETIGVEPLGGWESPDSEIRGCFLSFYLQAAAKAYLTYGDTELWENANFIVDELYKIQKILNESGFLAAYPSTFLTEKLENLETVWSPIYVYEKGIRGLKDMQLIGGNEKAGIIVEGMIEWLYQWMVKCHEKYTMEHWRVMIFRDINYEYGGMNEMLYSHYRLTGDPKYFWMAQSFDDGNFLGSLLLNQQRIAYNTGPFFDGDWLRGIHANSHIAPVYGLTERVLSTGESNYHSIVHSFFSTVWYHHSYITGGSNGGNGSTYIERYSDPDLLSVTLWRYNQEFCVQYNTLKILQYLYTYEGNALYMDHYERVLVNTIWGTQKPKVLGQMLYSYPMGMDVSKPLSLGGGVGWGTYDQSFWCCYTTAVDQWTKMAEGIYWKLMGEGETIRGIGIQLFISSVLQTNIKTMDNNGTNVGVMITQKTAFPRQSFSTFSISLANPTHSTSFSLFHLTVSATFTLSFRVPQWALLFSTFPTPSNLSIILNNNTILANSSTLLSCQLQGVPFNVTRKWMDGDVITFSFPMGLSFAPINDDDHLIGIQWGPVVLGTLSNGTSYDILLPSYDVENYVEIIEKEGEGVQPLEFQLTNWNGVRYPLVPLYDIVDEVYSVYLHVNESAPFPVIGDEAWRWLFNPMAKAAEEKGENENVVGLHIKVPVTIDGIVEVNDDIHSDQGKGLKSHGETRSNKKGGEKRSAIKVIREFS